MVLPSDLEDWLTDEGDRVVTQMATSAGGRISDPDRAIYEIWLLDTETRNGGVSQYFDNRGLSQWQSLRQIAAANEFTSLTAFIAATDAVITGATDPFDAIIHSNVDVGSTYYDLQTAIVGELRDSSVA